MKGSKGILALMLALMVVSFGIASAEVVRGKVTVVDLKANRISVQAEGAEKNFTFDPQDFIVWQGDDEVKTEDIKAGVEAEVGYYTDENGLEIASWVDLTPLEEGEEVAVPPEDILPAETEVAPETKIE